MLFGLVTVRPLLALRKIVLSSSTMSTSPTKVNRLVKAKSPYLRQHMKNPVDWYEWNAEAFEKARNENLPIFLSVGYSACQ